MQSTDVAHIDSDMETLEERNMDIIRMTEKDYGEILAMMRVFYASPAISTNGSEEIFRADLEHCLNDDPFVEGYVFYEEHNLVGYAIIAKSFSAEFGKHCVWIEDLYLKPAYCGKGYGTQFLRFIAKQYPDMILRLEVDKENVRAIYVYRKNGFEEFPYIEMLKQTNI